MRIINIEEVEQRIKELNREIDSLNQKIVEAKNIKEVLEYSLKNLNPFNKEVIEELNTEVVVKPVKRTNSKNQLDNTYTRQILKTLRELNPYDRSAKNILRQITGRHTGLYGTLSIGQKLKSLVESGLLTRSKVQRKFLYTISSTIIDNPFYRELLRQNII